jgi:hypothetical protein
VRGKDGSASGPGGGAGALCTLRAEVTDVAGLATIGGRGRARYFPPLPLHGPFLHSEAGELSAGLDCVRRHQGGVPGI